MANGSTQVIRRCQPQVSFQVIQSGNLGPGDLAISGDALPEVKPAARPYPEFYVGGHAPADVIDTGAHL